MTWYTCAPVSFGGGPDFFCRDSGLICKGFQSLGTPCKSIMPLPEHPDDIREDLLRTEAENLARPDWWRSIGASNVVLYSWAHYKWWRIAQAVQDSGAKAFLNLDGAGIMSPRVAPGLYFRAIIGRQIRLHGPVIGALTGILRGAAYRFYIPYVQEPGRIAHMRAVTAMG